MRHRTLVLIGLVLLVSNQAQALFHRADVQWQVSEAERSTLKHHFHVHNIRFSTTGQPLVLGLSPTHQGRWGNFYKQCMSDGCMYCDAPRGSCEHKTCGVNNSQCKPRLSRNKVPVCGYECAYYALSRL